MPIEHCCPVVELRQYTLHPGQRETLIELFDREFVESQEALGMRIIGQFRDIDRPDRFVWLRGFADMDVRDTALRAFYGGPVWAAHRAAANATMIDASNVLLLRPARAGGGFRIKLSDRAPISATICRDDLVVVTICHLNAPPDAGPDFIGLFEDRILPAIANAGARVAAYFVTEASANTFPALPVRDGESVFVWFSTFRNSADYATHLARRDGSRRWLDEILPDLCRQLVRDPEVLRLSPTPRSLLVHSVE